MMPKLWIALMTVGVALNCNILYHDLQAGNYGMCALDAVFVVMCGLVIRIEWKKL